ncbi:MAG: GNAT family N-acetyltransferase [Bacteroidales bacterium]
MEKEVIHNFEKNRFEWFEQGQRATLSYCFPLPGSIEFTHTFVPQELAGRGIASKLAKAALEYAAQRHLEPSASCSFMQRYMATH